MTPHASADSGKIIARFRTALHGYIGLQNIPFWMGAVATGLFAVGYAQSVKWLSSIPVRLFEAHPLVLLPFTPLCFLLGWWLVHRFSPEAAALFHSTHSNLFILAGMIGFLTSVTHAPFTSLVLVLEMTDRHSAIFPMMLSALVAYAIGIIIEPLSFYERMKSRYL